MPLRIIESSEREDVPPGGYEAALKSVESVETPNAKTLKALRWTFAIDKGERSGQTISDLSDADRPTTANKLGRWLAALAAKPLTAGVAVNEDDYIGKRYFVIVKSVSGKSKIETFTPLP